MLVEILYLLTVITLWATNAIPAYIISVGILVTAPLIGLVSFQEAGESLSDSTVLLFLGVFTLTSALQRNGFLEFIQKALFRKTVQPYEMFLLKISSSVFILSSFISNTIVTAFMTPLVMRAVSEVEDKRLVVRALLSISFFASLGGLITPFGTPPNGITISNLEKVGIEITLLEWMYRAVPIALTVSVICWLSLRQLFGSSNNHIKLVADSNNLREPMALTFDQRVLAFGLFVIIVLLIIPDFSQLKFPLWYAVWLPLAALMSISSLIKRPIVTIDDVQAIPWTVIILFAGGICLGAGLQNSKLLETFIFSGVVEDLSPIYVATISTVTSEFASNTASAALLVPIFSQTVPSLSLVSGLSASFGFLLPISTPSNAIIFATGQISIRQMMIAGFIVDLIGVIVISVFQAIGLLDIT